MVKRILSYSDIIPKILAVQTVTLTLGHPVSIHFHFRESEATGGPADQVQGLHQDQQAEDLGPRRDEPESLGADDRAGGGVRGA